MNDQDGPGPQAAAPDEAAVRDGAPLVTGRAVDPALVAAERVIAQLRALVGALTVAAGGSVSVEEDALRERRARAVRIAPSPSGGFTLSVPDAEPAAAPPSSRNAEVRRAGDSALMRRLARLAAEHAGDHDAGSDAQESPAGTG